MVEAGPSVPAETDWVVDLERQGWSDRPFARTFDLLASQYGWTDEQILDLTLARMRQARDVCFERMAEERRKDLSVREAELRVLASFIAGSAGHKDGVTAARKIRLLQPPDPEKVVKEIPFERALGMFGAE